MIERAILLIVSGGKGENISLNGTEFSAFDATVNTVSESDVYYTIKEDREKRVIWVLPTENGVVNPHQSNPVDYFSNISHLLEYIVLFDLCPQSKTMSGEVFKKDNIEFTHLRLVEENSGDHGQKCVESVSKLVGVELAFEWDDFVTSYPLSREI